MVLEHVPLSLLDDFYILLKTSLKTTLIRTSLLFAKSF